MVSQKDRVPSLGHWTNYIDEIVEREGSSAIAPGLAVDGE